MPNMPGLLAKTKTFSAMDKIWTASPATFMAAYASSSFTALLNDAVAKGLIDQKVADHVTNHWLGTYWPTAEARDVLHRGLYWAMRVATFEDGDPARHRHDDQGQERTLPICCAWVCSGGQSASGKPRFEVITLESEHQVTLLFVTPMPKDLREAKPRGALEPVWATRHIAFPVETGEHQLETWGPEASGHTTRTVRPHDFEDFTPGP